MNKVKKERQNVRLIVLGPNLCKNQTDPELMIVFHRSRLFVVAEQRWALHCLHPSAETFSDCR